MDENSSSNLWFCVEPDYGYIQPKNVADLYTNKVVFGL